MSCHRGDQVGAVAVSSMSLSMGPHSPSRRYASGTNSTGTASSGLGSSMSKINHRSTSNSSYQTSYMLSSSSPALSFEAIRSKRTFSPASSSSFMTSPTPRWSNRLDYTSPASSIRSSTCGSSLPIVSKGTNKYPSSTGSSVNSSSSSLSSASSNKDFGISTLRSHLTSAESLITKHSSINHSSYAKDLGIGSSASSIPSVHRQRRSTLSIGNSDLFNERDLIRNHRPESSLSSSSSVSSLAIDTSSLSCASSRCKSKRPFSINKALTTSTGHLRTDSSAASSGAEVTINNDDCHDDRDDCYDSDHHNNNNNQNSNSNHSYNNSGGGNNSAAASNNRNGEEATHGYGNNNNKNDDDDDNNDDDDNSDSNDQDHLADNNDLDEDVDDDADSNGDNCHHQHQQSGGNGGGSQRAGEVLSSAAAKLNSSFLLSPSAVGGAGGSACLMIVSDPTVTGNFSTITSPTTTSITTTVVTTVATTTTAIVSSTVVNFDPLTNRTTITNSRNAGNPLSLTSSSSTSSLGTDNAKASKTDWLIDLGDRHTGFLQGGHNGLIENGEDGLSKEINLYDNNDVGDFINRGGGGGAPNAPHFHNSVFGRPSGTHNDDNPNAIPSTSRRTDSTLYSNNSVSSSPTNQSVTGHGSSYHRGYNDPFDGSPSSRSARNRPPTHYNERCGLNGLRNLGNTCFMNSVIQCLSNTRPLLEYLLNQKYLADINTTTSSMKGALIKAFNQVIHELWEIGSDQIVNTNALKSHIQKFAPRFMGYSQQDAQEFLRYLLEGLHEDVNRVTVKPQPLHTDIPDVYTDSQKATESWTRYLRSEDSMVVDIFVGQLRSSLRCTSCNHVSLTWDPVWDLSLPIPARNGPVKLSQCLEHFTREEVLDGDEKPTCSKCQMRRKCTKSFSIQKFPKILVIHLKRFSPMERFRGKLNVLVDFPLTGLDLSAFAAPKVQGCTYNLYGVANHSGTTYSGHYTAYCKHPYSGEWHEYNDSRVSMIPPSSVVSDEAYVLFYEQQPHSSHL